jgi:hypothetical protein
MIDKDYKFVPTETLHKDDDDGTMVQNVSEFAELVVGHRIVNVAEFYLVGSEFLGKRTGLRITLDTGRTVELSESGDCCAYTELKSFLWNADKIDHVITGVSTLNGYTTWSIYADLGDVLALQVAWSQGSGSYGYGFEMVVTDPEEGGN